MSLRDLLPHLLDPAWRRVPFPVSPKMSVSAHGPISVIKMQRSYFGRELLPVHCYAIGDTLVDTGIASLGAELSAFVTSHNVRRAVVTHHHEDHAGNAARLVEQGLQVVASTRTAELVSRRSSIHFYQHVLWGAMPAAHVLPLNCGASLAARCDLGGYEAEVIATPGHCGDQVAFFVPEEGWLFSGDAFIHEHVRMFRRDEDFALTVTTLEKLLTYDFDVLFCAHRPRTSGGHVALAAKLQWLRDIEGQTRALHAAGTRESAIVRHLGIERRGLPALLPLLSFGDVSAANMVSSILHGPRLRFDDR